MPFIPKPIQIKKFLEKHNIAYVEKGNNIMMNSPFTVDSKLRCQIYTGETTTKKWCGIWNDFKAQEGSRDFIHFVQRVENEKDYNVAKRIFLTEFVRDLSHLKEEVSIKKVKKKELYFPDSFRLLKDSDMEFIQYLENRKIEYKQMKLLIDEIDKRIVFPFYEDGELVYWSARTILPETEPRWKHAPNPDERVFLYGLENCSFSAYLFEGIVDALSFNANSIAYLKSTISEEQVKKMIKHGIVKVYYVGDNDQASENVREQNLNLLSGHFPNVFYYDWKESSYKEKDFSEIKMKYGSIERLCFKDYDKFKYKMERVKNDNTSEKI